MFLMDFKCFKAFLQVFSSVFFCMLQLLHLDVSKIDWVLHMGCAWEAAGGAAMRAMFGVVWTTSRAVRATSGEARAHCYDAPSRA
jgi:hypothetical protein